MLHFSSFKNAFYSLESTDVLINQANGLSNTRTLGGICGALPHVKKIACFRSAGSVMHQKKMSQHLFSYQKNTLYWLLLV